MLYFSKDTLTTPTSQCEKIESIINRASKFSPFTYFVLFRITLVGIKDSVTAKYNFLLLFIYLRTALWFSISSILGMIRRVCENFATQYGRVYFVRSCSLRSADKGLTLTDCIHTHH